ncbi:ABC transporter substrate-binding protein [Chloroflexota bacterium]
MKGKMKSKLLLLPLVFLAVIGLIVVSCAPIPTPTPTPTTPKPEGTLVYGSASMRQELFLAWQARLQDAMGFLAVYDTLGYPSAEMRPIPGLAKQWEYSTDFRTLTFSLREGIQFQGGWGELTADDVKYSIEQTMSEGSVAGRAPVLRRTIESLEVKDPYTLVIHQKTPSGYTHVMFTIENYHIPIVCKKHLETVGIDEANLHPVGSGPWRLVEHEFGDYLKYEAAEEHWRVVPEFKNLVIRIVPEESTRVAMLKAGQIDATAIGPASMAEIPKEDFTISVLPVGGANTCIIFGGMVMSEDKRYVEGYHKQDPWADVRVREAMNIAIDREALNKALEKGTAREAAISLQTKGWEELEPIPYDPDRAKKLLAEAGYPNGFSFDLVSSPTHPGCPMLPKETEAVAGYWIEIGLEPKIIPLEFGAWRNTLLKAEAAGTLTSYKYSYAVDYAAFLDHYMPDGTQAVFQDAELTRLGEKIMNEPDPMKQEPLYEEYTKYQRNNYVTVPLFIIPQIVVSNRQQVGEWPPYWSPYYAYFEYIRHAEPLNTWRLFTP